MSNTKFTFRPSHSEAKQLMPSRGWATFLSWAEISQGALQHNIKVLRKRVGSQVILAPSVKANAYGHGMVEISKMALSAGADWLCVNALFEVEILRKAGIKAPIYIMGYILKSDLPDAVRLKARIVTYNRETIVELAKAARKQKTKAKVHLKIETGNNRQGIASADILDFVKFAQQFPEIEVEGLATHFANIEDARPSLSEAKQLMRPKGATIDRYARFQLENFKRALAALRARGIKIPIPHCANSAATILFPETHFAMVRPGIAVYGLWPSPEVKEVAKKKHQLISLKPVLSWKTRIAQIKEIPKGSFVGYGCTYQTKRKTRLAILPVGYYDGYDRGFSNKSHVLIHGKRAPVRGRVCMNITMVDVTDIPMARVEDTVTLLGRDGREAITAEYLADLIETINYEITTRIHEGIPRIQAEPQRG